MLQDLAPYACAPTSILVYRGKGVLVKRCETREAAVALAIEEFALTCPSSSVSLTTFVGAQGREVEVGKSAFAYVKDTIPLHVHVKEEDHGQNNREASRWPAVSLDPQPLEYFGPTASIFSSPHQPLQTHQQSKVTRNRTETSQSNTGTLSDWKKGSTGTPDTAISIHRAGGQVEVIMSPEEMFMEQQGKTQTTSLQAEAAASNEEKRPWNWWKKAFGAVASDEGKDSEKGMNLEIMDAERFDAKVGKESETGIAVQTQQSIERNPPSRQEDTTLNDSRESKLPELQTKVSISASITDDSQPSTILSDSVLHTSNPDPSDTEFGESASSSWGPGGLILVDESEGKSWQTETPASTLPENPWWSKSDEIPLEVKNSNVRKKVGLKPLQLVGSGNNSNSGDSESVSNGRAKNHHKQATPSTSLSQSPFADLLPVFEMPTRPLSLKSKVSLRKSATTKPSSPCSPVTPDSRFRPLPCDLPESPASSKRFTRNADQFDTSTIMDPLPPIISARKRSQHDIVPVVPVAKSKQAAMSDTLPRPKGTKNLGPSRAIVPPLKLDRALASPQDEWPSTPRADEMDQITSQPQRSTQLPTYTTSGKRQQHNSKSSQEVKPDPTTIRSSQPSVPKVQKPVSDPSFRPEVPVASEANARPKTSQNATAEGPFARAAFAARRQMSHNSKLPAGSEEVRETNRATAKKTSQQPQVPIRSKPPHLPPRQRTSLSSIKDFVPATIAPPKDIETSESWTSESAVSTALETSWQSTSTIPSDITSRRTASIKSVATGFSRDSYVAGKADTVFLDRVILGPMDLASPNRKGSQLILKVYPATGQLSIEWRQEKKVVVSIGFDALSAVQLPGPDCKEHFILLKPRTGIVREVLLEVDEENLLHFQRFVLILIAGAGADIEHLSASAFKAAVAANEW